MYVLLNSHAQQKLENIMREAHAVCKYTRGIVQPLGISFQPSCAIDQYYKTTSSQHYHNLRTFRISTAYWSLMPWLCTTEQRRLQLEGRRAGWAMEKCSEPTISLWEILVRIPRLQKKNPNRAKALKDHWANIETWSGHLMHQKGELVKWSSIMHITG